MFLLKPRYRAISHVGVINAHLPHGVNVDGTVINRALCDIIVNIFGVVATGLAMYIDRSVVCRNFQVGIEAEASNGWSLSSLLGEVLNSALHGDLCRRPHHFLTRAQ